MERLRLSVEEYLRLEQDAAERHEYDDGEILAMAGGSYEHSLIISNCNRLIGNALVGKPCRVLDGNLKIGIPSLRKFVYPDVQVICGPPQFDPRDTSRQAVINPRLVIEVLSPSTEAYDRGRKFEAYRQLESLEEYMMFTQDEASVQTCFRQPEGTWLLTPYSGLDAVVKVRSLGFDVRMEEIYAGVEFTSKGG